ncbi:MAG: fimbrillin family protein [Prevotella sp.]|nr:fimbrillin family protein [Prevotella sp.]
MTKALFYSSMLALALSSCTNDEIASPSENSGEAVSFNTVLGPSTRGAVFSKTDLQIAENGFFVSAYNTGAQEWTAYTVPAAPDFMNNTEVTWSTDKWTYNPVKYWPGKVDGTNYGKVTFFTVAGLASASNAITYNASTYKPEFAYTTDPAAANQKDLVADALFNETWSNGKKVKFQFNHILSKIGFTAKLAEQYSDATVKIIALQVNYTDSKVKNSGVYAFNTNGTNATVAEGAWTTGASYLSGNSGDLRAGNTDVTLDNTASPTATTINDAAKFLMLIPQTTASEGDLTVSFTYSVQTGADPAVLYPVTYKLPATTYVLGKQYTYNFTLTLNPVVFDADLTVEGWEDGSAPADIVI